MRLIDALQVIRTGRERADARVFALATGFTPIHLATFLQAQLQRALPTARADVEVGQFGDLVGNVRRAATSDAVGLAVVLEWQDVDPRLGLRESGDWEPTVLDDIVQTAGVTLGRVASAVRSAAERIPIALCLPTLPLPPVAYTMGSQASAFELSLRARLAQFAAELATLPRVRVVSEQAIDATSPVGERLSVKSDLATGLPYAQAHADAVAHQLSRLLLPAAPRKGLVTDLDDTLWLGVLGEVGAAGVQWDLANHARVHGLYQQFVAALAGSGVLVAVASKNDETLVEEAFRRSDLLLARDQIFPLLASWGSKSKAIEAVLAAWNVGADSLVFVDDSPIELAEVQSRHPEVECRLFPKNDPDAVLRLLVELRDLFGRPALQKEDALRRESLRSASALREAAAASADDEEAFAASLDATVTLTLGDVSADDRAFELINKTNQFNVNGRRYLESEWQSLRARDRAVALSVTYADKFGALGKIAVLTGAADDRRVLVERWVMSCRAFARRIEYATVRALFDEFGVDEIVVDHVPTPRNGPSRDFLRTLADVPDRPGEVVIRRADFDQRCPPLYQRIEHAPLAEATDG
jgi:FkbH-like protein